MRVEEVLKGLSPASNLQPLVAILPIPCFYVTHQVGPSGSTRGLVSCESSTLSCISTDSRALTHVDLIRRTLCLRMSLVSRPTLVRH